VLAGKLWTLAVPIGSIAYRMSLFSAACARGGVRPPLPLCRQARSRERPALLAALLLALAPSFWGEANVQRVYALGALFVVAATDGRVSAGTGPRPAPCSRSRSSSPGLGATAHIFMTVYALALGAFVLCASRGSSSARASSPRAAPPRAGLAVYAYLPFRSRMNPRVDWGNPETLRPSSTSSCRRDFWMRAWDRAAERRARSSCSTGCEPRHRAHVGRRGARRWSGRRRLARGLPVLLPLLVMAGNVASMAAHGSRSDLFIWHRYYIPSYAMAACSPAIGCQARRGASCRGPAACLAAGSFRLWLAR
jgi:hypothetical protein